ncbi:MAG: ABC transporter permease [Pirellulaceae bacterium]
MKTPLALHNLLHQPLQTGVSIAGVAFALLLVFMQLGFMGAVAFTATNVLEQLEFDVLLRAPDYLHLYEAGQIERSELKVAANTSGVRSAQPLWISVQNWRSLPTRSQLQDEDFQSQYLPIAVMAFEPSLPVFRSPQIQTLSSQLREDTILLDDSTQADYGPLDDQPLIPFLPWRLGRFSDADVGRETEIGGKAFTITGLYRLGTGLAANGALITSPAGFARMAPIDINTTTSLGLLQLDSSDAAEQAQVIERIKQRLRVMPSGVRPQNDTVDESAGVMTVLSKEEALAAERFRWLWQTPFGLIFQMGVVLSLLVGSAIVYMILSTDVSNRLSEYATLLAMGYSRLYLSSIVMTQAIVLSLFGFAASWIAAELLYRLTYNLTGIPLLMNSGRIGLVAGLGILMSCVSGLLALRKLWKAEPASLF